MFEINGLRFSYSAITGNYYVVDVNYGVSLGLIKLQEGPGWIVDLFANSFLDEGQLRVLLEIVSFLNSDLEE